MNKQLAQDLQDEAQLDLPNQERKLHPLMDYQKKIQKRMEQYNLKR